MRYYAGYLITGDAADYYLKLTRDLSQHFGIKNLGERSAPHFTFKAPFETDDIQTFEEMVAAAARECQQVPIELQGFERFDAESKTIYLKITDNPAFRAQAEKIIAALEPFGENRRQLPLPFRPHMSIARFLTPEQSHAIWEHLSTLPEPQFTIVFDNITIFVHDGQRWQIQATVAVPKVTK